MKKVILVAAMLAMLLLAIVPAVAQDNGNVCSVPVDVSNTGDATSNTVVVPSQSSTQDASQVNAPENTSKDIALGDSDNDGDLDKLVEDLDLEDLEDLDEGVLDDLGDLLSNDGKAGDVSLNPDFSNAQDLDQTNAQNQETDVEGGDASIEVSPSVNVNCNQTVDQDAEANSY